MTKFLELTRGDFGVVTLTINRPDALNALNLALMGEMRAVLTDLSKDESVRVLVLRGAGEKAFIAGADIKEMQNMDRAQAVHFSREGHAVCLLLEQMPKVTVAAVHGFALGGGMEVALACDFILASDKAQFGLPEVSLGVIPGFGGTIRLARTVGTARAKELVFSGSRISSGEAKELGLVRKVFGQAGFFTEVKDFAEKIAKNSLPAIIAAKNLMNEFQEMSGIYPKVDAEVHRFCAMFAGDDQKEGMTAFVEKRQAKFIGLNGI